MMTSFDGSLMMTSFDESLMMTSYPGLSLLCRELDFETFRSDQFEFQPELIQIIQMYLKNDDVIMTHTNDDVIVPVCRHSVEGI